MFRSSLPNNVAPIGEQQYRHAQTKKRHAKKTFPDTFKEKLIFRLLPPALSKEKICLTYFKICALNFKIQGTYFLHLENLF